MQLSAQHIGKKSTTILQQKTVVIHEGVDVIILNIILHGAITK